MESFTSNFAIKFLFILCIGLTVTFRPVLTRAFREKRATGCAAIQIVSRASWGVNSGPFGDILQLPVNYFFIHHTEGPTCNDQQSCSSIVKGMYNYHTQTKNWGDIGYSFLVGGDGRIYEGRGWDKVGAHTYGWNTRALAISFIGSYTSSLPSSIMINAAKNLILCGISKNKISSNYGLYGHRDGTCTSCPGDAFYNTLNSWGNWHKFGTIQKFCSG